MQDIVYIKAPASCVVYDRNITLGDIIKVECSNAGICRMVKQMKLYSFNHEHSEVFSILKVIERIHEDYPGLEIVNCGETDFVVEYKKSTVKSSVFERIKLILVSIVVFFGSAFTIMAFHNDIGIQDVFARFYEQLMGEEKPMVTELEISYSVGLAIGIIVFFNHFSKRMLTKDPTPIEVEMKKYGEDITTTKIAQAQEKGHEQDVS